MVRYKHEVYEWFQKLDSSNRVDFMCSMLKLCLPIELRLLGTCLEHLAKKDYMALRDIELKANDARQLEDLKKDFMKSHIRSKLVIYLSLLHTKSSSLCSNIFLSILTEMFSNFQQYASSSPKNLPLLEDISLLLNVAVHHPAFTLLQQQELINQRENFNALFGVHINAEEQLTESQTNLSPTSFAQVNEPNYDANGGESATFSEAKAVTNIKPNHKSHINQPANSQQQRSGSNSQVSLDVTHTQGLVIRSLTLENTEKAKRGCLYTIKVNLVDGGHVIVKYDWNSIQEFHNKLLRRFPDDANSKKNVRQIPLLKVNLREDEIGGVVRAYLSDLCKMPVHMLQSQLVHEYFITPNIHLPDKSPANATSSKAIGLLPTPSITIVSSKLSAQNAQNPTGSHSSTSITSTSQVTMNDAPSPRKSTSNSNIYDNQQQSAKTSGSSLSWGPVSQKVKTPTSPRFSNTSVASDNANEMKNGDLYALLKANRLQKYHNLLKDLTMQQCLQLSHDEIVAMGVANGAARKLMDILERMRVSQTQGGRTNMQKFSSAPCSPSGTSLSQSLYGSQPPSESSGSEYSPHTSPNNHSGKPVASKSDASDFVNKQASRAPYSTITKPEQREAGNSSGRPSTSTALSSQGTSFPSQNNRSQNHNPSNSNSRKTQSRTFEASSGSVLTRTASETSIGKRDDNTPKKESPIKGNSRNNSNWRNFDKQHTGTFPRANNVRENREPVRYDPPRYSNSRENSNVRLQPPREPNTRSNARISPRDATPKQQLQHSRASPHNITLIDTKQLPPSHNIEIQKNSAVIITNEQRSRENVPVSVEPTILVRDDRPNAVSVGAGPQSLLSTPEIESPIYMPNGPMEAVFVDPMVQQMAGGPIENQTLCGCPQCMPNWQSGWYTPGIPLPHGNMPPGGMVTSQNGYIYQSYPQPQTFVPTSNGLISPGLPPPAFRTNNPGVPPNGMISREVMFPPPFMMPPSRHPFPSGIGPVPGMYFAPSGGKRQCINCGGNGHISTECPEPADTMSSSSNFKLDMRPRSDMSE